MDLSKTWIDFSKYDAIVIPGAGGPRDGLDPLNSLPEWVERKLSSFAKQYLEQQSATPIITLSAGTYHKPGSLDCNGRNFNEATGMTLYLEHLGVPIEQIYEELASYDTVGNAFFLRLIHTSIRNWNKLLIIVNQFHYPRLKLIFDWIFGISDNKQIYHLEYSYYPDNLLKSQKIINARWVRECSSLVEMKQRIKNLKINNLLELHQWIFQSHDLYRAKNRKQLVMVPKKNELNIDPDCIDSY